MKTQIFKFLTTAVLLLTSCGNLPAKAVEPKLTLERFFLLLSQGEYTEADRLFGGDYQTLIDWNPVINPSEHAKLWEAACKINGAQCLETTKISYVETQDDIFIFKVEFKNPDGSFFLAPSPQGGNLTQFTMRVKKIAGVENTTGIVYQVIDLPVYLP